MEQIFLELTVILLLATSLAMGFRFFKLPAILAYILTGILIGPLGIYAIQSADVLHSLGQIGITLLLFILGLELKVSELKSVGKTVLITGISQVLFTTIVGFLISLLLGFSAVSAVYMAIALTFSSTIIIVKLLSDKKDLNSLYGKIAVGMLLVQDFVAIVLLILLSGLGNQVHSTAISPWTIVLLFMKIYAVFGWVIVLSRTLLPKILNKIAKNQEILFLFSVAWAFGFAALVSSPIIGFSIEIGGFLAGLALAQSLAHYQIASRVRSLRDFFITIFFITLGMNMVFSEVTSVLIPATIFSLYVMIGNPIIVMIILGLLGYKKRTGFMTGLTVAQISEFSMIVMFLGNKLGFVSSTAVSVVTVVGAVTFVSSSYLITNANRFYTYLEPYLRIFEKKEVIEQHIPNQELKQHVIIVGANRMGESIVEAMLENKENIVVIDFDPDVISRLQKQKIPCFYGDIADTEIQERIHMQNARLIISTVPDVDDNLCLLEELRKKNKKTLCVVFSLEAEHAPALYKAGANYVVLPHLAGGRHLAKILVDKKHLELIEEFKARDSKYFV